MANCVLCGQKLGMFDQVKIDFHNTKQSVCSDCANRLDNAVGQDRAELFRQILDSPYLENSEDIRGDIYTGKLCPVCGATLHRRLRNFSIGSDGYGGLSSLGLPTYEVDLYSCPKCGKVELYTAGLRPEASWEEPEQVTCPDCGTRHSPRIGCPNCAMRQVRSGRAFQREERQSPGRKSKKVPWEK